MMDQPEHAGEVVVVCDPREPSAQELRSYLAAQEVGEVLWIHPRDADEVDRAVAAGRVRRVIWATHAAWLTALWDGMLVPRHWQRTNLKVEFADATGAADAPPVQALAAAWERWRHRQRRRQAVAGAVLSAVALIAAFVVLRF